MTQLRPQKNLAAKMIVESVVGCVEILRDVQKPDGWRIFSEKANALRKRLRLNDYVTLYQSEAGIGLSLLYGINGEEETKAIGVRLEAEGLEAQQAYVDSMARDSRKFGDDLDASLSHLSKDEDELKRTFENMPDEERAKLVKQGQCFFGFFLSWFHNSIAVMVLGEKLTSLVPKAMEGDMDTFCKAIHIDKLLLSNHLYFRDRHEQAQSNREEEFLRRIGRNLAASPIRGKIQYPGLYMVFAMLESVNWLDDFKHEEILDLCDKAGLDRWQNRIENVYYLTRRLIEYRNNQKKSSMSMH